MRVASVLLLLLGSAPAPAQDTDQKPRLAVSELTALQVSPEEAAALTDAVVQYLTARNLFEVLSPRDAQTLLGAERQRQLLGACDADTCNTDLSKLLDARFVLSGQLARVGTAYQLTLQMVDTRRTGSAGRASRLAGSLTALRELVPYLASEATGAPLPPPPSRALPITFMATGGAAVLAGGAVALLAFSRESQLNAELCPSGPGNDGRCDGVNLRPRSFYLAQQEALTVQKVVAFSVAAAGAVLLGLGLWLLPPDDARTHLSLRLLPTGSGVALAGGF